MERITYLFILCFISQICFGQDLIERTRLNETIMKKVTTSNRIAQVIDAKQMEEAFTPVNMLIIDNNPSSKKNTHIVSDAVYFTIEKTWIETLRTNRPTNILFKIPVGNNHFIELKMAEINIKSDNYQLITSEGEISKRNNNIFYRGIVKEEPHTLATLSVLKGEIRLLIGDNGGNYILGKLGDSENDYMLYNENKLKKTLSGDWSCDTENIPAKYDSNTSVNVTKSSALGDCVKVYVEADYKIYQDQSSSVANVEDYVDAIFNEVIMAFYMAGINMEISEVFVWTSQDPYVVYNNTEDVLSNFKNNRPTFNGNLAHFITSRSGLGGRAYLPGLCTTTPYGMSGSLEANLSGLPTSSYTFYVIAHEIGHNLGLQHTHVCTWNGNNTQIDDCGSQWIVNNNFDDDNDGTIDELDEAVEGISCFDPNNPILPQSGGGAIMSYCHINALNIGVDIINGFTGDAQGNQIMQNAVTNATCLDASCNCTEDVNWLVAYSIDTTPTTCSSTTNGQASINIINGIVANVQWSTNIGLQTGNTATQLSVGTHTVIVTDINGCTEVSNFNITNGSIATPLEQKVANTQITSGDKFGTRSTVYDKFAVVGAHNDDEQGASSGSAYIYEKTGNNWTFMQRLLPNELEANDKFGKGIAVYENTIMVGAEADDDAANNCGAVYVYHYDGMSWIQTQKLLPSDITGGKNFGTDIAINGNKAIIGASRDDNPINNSGAAYIFKRNNTGNWVQEQKLAPNDPEDTARFGISVDISNDRAVVGAYFDDAQGTDSGAAYIFNFNGSTWSQGQKIVPPSSGVGDYVGRAVSIECDKLVVGAHLYDGADTDSGVVYAYNYNTNTNTWDFSQELDPTSAVQRNHVGYSVDISFDKLILSAHLGNASRGAAYIYEYDGTNWNQALELEASDIEDVDNFGYSVALHRNNVLVGSQTEDAIATDGGSAYFYRLPDNSGDLDNDGVCDSVDGCPDNLDVQGDPCGIDCFCFTSCEEVDYVTNSNYDANNSFYEASQSLIASNIVSNNDFMRYSAGQNVRLLPGFHAKRGSNFTASIQPCVGFCFRVGDLEGRSEESSSFKDDTNKALIIYPNPTNGSTIVRFYLNETAATILKVADLNGRIVHEQKYSGTEGLHEIEFDVYNWTKGIYIISIQQSDTMFVRKLLVQ